jgi:hypothetical protein
MTLEIVQSDRKNDIIIVKKWFDRHTFFNAVGKTIILFFLAFIFYNIYPNISFVELKKIVWFFIIIPSSFFSVISLYNAIANCFNRTCIYVQNNIIIVRHKPIPWQGNIQLKVAKIERFVIEKRISVCELRARTISGASKKLINSNSGVDLLFIKNILEDYYRTLGKKISNLPDRINVNQTYNSTTIVLKRWNSKEHPPWGTIVVILYVLLSNIISYLMVIKNASIPLACIIVIFSLFVSFFSIAKRLNRTYFVADPAKLAIYNKLIPWLGNKEIAASSLERIYYKRYVHEHINSNQRYIEIFYIIYAKTSLGKDIKLIKLYNDEEASFIKVFINDYFNIEDNERDPSSIKAFINDYFNIEDNERATTAIASNHGFLARIKSKFNIQ